MRRPSTRRQWLRMLWHCSSVPVVDDVPHLIRISPGRDASKKLPTMDCAARRDAGGREIFLGPFDDAGEVVEDPLELGVFLQDRVRQDRARCRRRISTSVLMPL